MEEKLYPVILYKMATPIIYNKGTKNEISHDTFLSTYYYSKDEAEKICKKLNTDKEFRRVWEEKHAESTGEKTYFVSEQPDMY